MSLFQTEKDAIVFLGLMAYAYKNYDAPISVPEKDGSITHTKGLNIFAAITDNVDGEIVGISQNSIHSQNNPMLHAEQLTLKKAIERINRKRPRDETTTSVERYYRELLFNSPDSAGNFLVGGTIYTTLEPCPFCTAALLVNRMKRIVYVIPDAAYGSSYPYLKEKFYGKYDMTYAPLDISTDWNSELISTARQVHSEILQYVRDNLKQIATLYLDQLRDRLKTCYDFILSLTEGNLLTTTHEKALNLKTLAGLRDKL